MADEEYSNSMYKNNPPMTTFEEGYDHGGRGILKFYVQK